MKSTTQTMRSFLGAGIFGLIAATAACSSSTTSGGEAMDSGAAHDGAAMVDSGSADAATSLYTRLGGHSGIRGAINAIVAKELMDPEIASFFGNVGMPGHPTADQIEECFTDLLGSVAGGPETYPTTANGFQCRDMKSAHAGLHIPGSTFDKFVVIAAGVLKQAGVADADITTIGSVLNGTKPDIVDPNAIADAGPG